MIPLVVRNSAIGIAAFFHKETGKTFTDRDLSLALDLTYQMAGALQNILLLEQNLKMERLAAIGQTTSMVMHELTNILQLGKLAEECLRRGIDMNQEKYLKRAVDFNEKVDAGNFEGYRRYAKALKENADKPMSERRDLAMQAKSNYYRHENPLEVPAHKAGQTARETYKTFEDYNSLEGAQMPGSERSIVSTIVDKTRMTFDDILGLLKGGAEK